MESVETIVLQPKKMIFSAEEIHEMIKKIDNNRVCGITTVIIMPLMHRQGHLATHLKVHHFQYDISEAVMKEVYIITVHVT